MAEVEVLSVDEKLASPNANASPNAGSSTCDSSHVEVEASLDRLTRLDPLLTSANLDLTVRVLNAIVDLNPKDITGTLNNPGALLPRVHSSSSDVNYKEDVNELRFLRKVINRIGGASLPNKKEVDVAARKRDEKIRKSVRLAAMREEDNKQLENVALRQGRLKAMEALCIENGQGAELVVVPDGPTLTMLEDVTTRQDEKRTPTKASCTTTSLVEADTACDKEVCETRAKDEMNGNDTLMNRSRSCYVCKIRFYDLHHFYDSLCPSCGALNWEKRHQTACLDKSYVCLVTGGRVKIGFHTALKLLHAGATVIVTSRFRVDTLERFEAHLADQDSSCWRDRLVLLGCDLRYLPKIEAMCDWIEQNFTHLDVVIHNACQTIRRPHAYYEPLREKEKQFISRHVLTYGSRKSQKTHALEHAMENPGAQKLVLESAIPSVPVEGAFVEYDDSSCKTIGHIDPDTGSMSALEKSNPSTSMTSKLERFFETREDRVVQLGSRELPGHTDVNGQLLDYRPEHSWVYKLENVETPELVECFLINTMAPFVMNGRFKKLLERSPRKRKFIVNVSAMEGKFYKHKTPNHPHTNMAKAALNMMTKTAAQDYKKQGIYMNSIDTGWINDEKPLEQAAEHSKRHGGWQTPIDEIDAAARILDPVFVWIHDKDGKCKGEDTEPVDGSTNSDGAGKTRKQDKDCAYGMFLKDYFETEW